FLGQVLGGRQEARAEAGDGDYCFLDLQRHTLECDLLERRQAGATSSLCLKDSTRCAHPSRLPVCIPYLRPELPPSPPLRGRGGKGGTPASGERGERGLATTGMHTAGRSR